MVEDVRQRSRFQVPAYRWVAALVVRRQVGCFSDSRAAPSESASRENLRWHVNAESLATSDHSSTPSHNGICSWWPRCLYHWNHSAATASTRTTPPWTLVPSPWWMRRLYLQPWVSKLRWAGSSVITFPNAGSASAKKKRPKSVTPTRSARKNTFRQVATAIGCKLSGRIASWPLTFENTIKNIS